MATAVDELGQLRERLAVDTPFYAEHALQIIDKNKRRVRFHPKDEQLRFDAALEEQRRNGQPMRAIVLKARQIGFSTWTQAKMIQHVTQSANADALAVAHDMSTAQKLYRIGYTMWQFLPPDPELGLKPTIKHRRAGRKLEFGNSSRLAADAGDPGINSTYAVDTAKEVQSGRGGTLSALHGSEVAFWDDIEGKLTGLLESVPEDPDTLVVLESTAKGFNEFYDRWDDAWNGRSEYIPFFSAWFEEPSYTHPFLNEAEREEFILSVGKEAIGQDEPGLIERFGLTYEQLNWRRRKIRSSFRGQVAKFKVEYPATPDEAFLSTGSKVFEPEQVARIVARTQKTDPRQPTDDGPGPEIGRLEITKKMIRNGRHGKVEVPTEHRWVKKGFAPQDGGETWRVWEQPQPGVPYIAALDPSDDEETDRGELAWNAIQIINHKTLEQAAEYRSREPAHLVKEQLYVAAMYWNQAFIVIERTGGYGSSIASTIYHDWRWSRSKMYFRKAQAAAHEKESDRLGWSTNKETKPELLTTASCCCSRAPTASAPACWRTS
jgi:hypothetical protein